MKLEELKDCLLSIPDADLDNFAKDFIRKWNITPTAIQLLEVLDNIVRYSLSCDLVVQFLDMQLKTVMLNENITMEELEVHAIWRNQMN
jgi:hypothetical protein